MAPCVIPKAIGLFKKHLGRKIAELRLKKGWTQPYLAEMLDCSWRQIQYWESGRNPNAYNLFKLSHVLGCKVDDFFDVVTAQQQPKKLKVVPANGNQLEA